VLANRLKVVLPEIIYPTQSAFIPRKLITDNILAAYETLHSMQTRMWSKVGFMGIKLDMSKASRGIRQGDPISPYLFLICAETLSALLQRVERRGVITGVPTSPRGPRMSHLFFANDSLLFCKSNFVEWQRLLRILEVYEAGSGQKLNLNKTYIFF
jgi:hypothetical protein